MGKTCLKQVSELNWQIPSDKACQYLKESALLRIAEAVELMAKDHKDLVRDRDDYERWYREENGKVKILEKRIAGLKGYITKLKKRRK